MWAAVHDLKSQEKVGKIGVSVYHPTQLEKVLERCDIDLVQLPFNLYDQRFAQTGMLRQLKRKGVEVHARSTFLQGLLLLPPEKLPEHFHAFRSRHAELHRRTREAGLSPRDVCLRFCLDHADIDKVVVGCETMQQLGEIIDSAEKVAARIPWTESCAIDDESLIDPSKWPVTK